MSKGWDYASKIADRMERSGGNFIKLENDGDKVVGAFIGDPNVEELVWNGTKYEPFTKKHEAEGKKPSARFTFNFYTVSENGTSIAPKVKVFNCTLKTFKTIAKVREKYGTENWFFEIERKGKKGDTDTTYTVLPDEKIDEETKKRLQRALAAHEAFLVDGDDIPEGVLQLHDLRSGGGKREESHEEPARKVVREEPREAGGGPKLNELRDRLKALPRDVIDTFLDRFDIQSVKELDTRRIGEAFSFVEQAEAKRMNGTQQRAADPFGD